MDRETEEQIKRRAYELWQSEGCPSGRDQEHWDQAQKEIIGHTDGNYNTSTSAGPPDLIETAGPTSATDPAGRKDKNDDKDELLKSAT
jgi:hypothetical protein